MGGVLRCLKLKEDSAIDMVYGDYVVNATLAAGYDVSSGKNAEPPIYNIVSSNDYVKTFGMRSNLRHCAIDICSFVRCNGNRNLTTSQHCRSSESSMVSSFQFLPL